MLENCQSAKERWGGVSDIIDRWLRERQDLIVRYCDLIGRGDFDDCETAVTTFRQFCQVLLDYVSAGHFEVYEQLIEEAQEFNDGGMELVNDLFPNIQKTTLSALDFNDKFDKTPEELEEINAMLPELSKLGEKLEERFELEDMLIARLHTVHADNVA